jgi:hypothetical protein
MRPTGGGRDVADRCLGAGCWLPVRSRSTTAARTAHRRTGNWIRAIGGKPVSSPQPMRPADPVGLRPGGWRRWMCGHAGRADPPTTAYFFCGGCDVRWYGGTGRLRYSPQFTQSEFTWWIAGKLAAFATSTTLPSTPRLQPEEAPPGCRPGRRLPGYAVGAPANRCTSPRRPAAISRCPGSWLTRSATVRAGVCAPTSRCRWLRWVIRSLSWHRGGGHPADPDNKGALQPRPEAHSVMGRRSGRRRRRGRSRRPGGSLRRAGSFCRSAERAPEEQSLLPWP